ncbi:hypothetical protein ACUDTH_06785 [Stenotrophomonas pavanii]|uniref:hypothetical protein n=1 Tax=Stenotrophomonas pavanii TaxID=487698 RepID=UPI004041E04F
MEDELAGGGGKGTLGLQGIDRRLQQLHLAHAGLGLANGFAPEKVSRQYETTRALKNYEQHILDRRKSLVNAFAMALRNGNASDRASVLSKIGAFNKANPELAITSSGLQQSIKNRARYSARAEAGIVLNPKLEARLNKAVTE